MHYLTLLHAEPTSTPPPPGVMPAIMALGQEASTAGVLVTQAGLEPSANGAQVSLVDDTISVADGPFAETKELLSYAVYDCRSLGEAVEWSRRFLAVHQDNWPGWTGEITIHPVFVPPAAPPEP
ncbi:MAG: YciI family protein [Mycobacteriaceae bacterium]